MIRGGGKTLFFNSKNSQKYFKVIGVEIYVQSCLELSGRKTEPVWQKHLLVPEAVYHFGRYQAENLNREEKDRKGLRHFFLNLATDVKVFPQQAFTLYFSKQQLRMLVQAPNGVLLQGDKIGCRSYAQGESAFLPLVSELKLMVMGEPLNYAQINISISENSLEKTPRSPLPGRMTLEDFRFQSSCLLNRGHKRECLIIVLLYVAMALQTCCYEQKGSFFSAKDLAATTEKYLCALSGETISVSPKQITEAGRSLANFYHLPVSASVAWVEIPQMLLRLGMLTPEENTQIWEYLREYLD